MTRVTCDGNKLIEAIGVDRAKEILDVLEIDLHDGKDTFCDACEWHCGAEKIWWPLDAHQLNLTDCYAVRWTYCNEVGIDDVEIVERVDDKADSDNLTTWLHEIAADAGSCDGKVR